MKGTGNALGRALEAHLEGCAWCTADRACTEYLEITRDFTARRVIVEGPRMGHTRLSVLEASG